MKELLSVEECLRQLLSTARVEPKVKKLRIENALGLVLANDIDSSIDVPPANNSAMDGYAIRYADLNKQGSSKSLPISQRIQAGSICEPLAPNSAARIFTGAEIPAGADTVVIQENVQEKNGIVHFIDEVKQGKNIRPQGQDIANGEVILTKGRKLTASDLGLIASIGIANVSVYEPLKVILVNSGDELIQPGTPLKKGQIYNSNQFLMTGLLQEWGYDLIETIVVPDNLKDTKTTLQKASESANVIISTGGVSVGEEDYLKAAVESLGELSLWKVAIKPGKPFAYGSINNACYIGLPGNPASAFVTAHIFAKPLLQKIQQENNAPLTCITTAIARFSKTGSKRQEYLRGRVIDGKVTLFPNQSSGVLKSVSWGNCLIIQHIGQDIQENDSIDILIYS